jgi:hypothetical protein
LDAHGLLLEALGAIDPMGNVTHLHAAQAPVAQALSDPGDLGDATQPEYPVWYGGAHRFVLDSEAGPGASSEETIAVDAVIADDHQIHLADPTDTLFIGLSYRGNAEVEAFSATLADGSSLPAWLALNPETGDLIAKPPPDRNLVHLRVGVRLNDGRTLEREVTIGLRTGAIAPGGGASPEATETLSETIPLGTEDFGAQLERTARRFEDGAAQLARALSD